MMPIIDASRLGNRTIADGLAVARASDFAYQMIGSQVMGAYTVTDVQMLAWLGAAAGDNMWEYADLLARASQTQAAQETQ
jgi:D-serine dehydratase